MNHSCLRVGALCLVVPFLLAAGSGQPAGAPALPDVDPSLLDFVKSFRGRGALEDGSTPLSPEETIRRFRVAPGLRMEVVAHEPVIRQPLNLFFDERGRLWVVQYIQYPNPAGLRVVSYDQHLRAVFDKVPPPPPNHFKGADKVTILEDRDGDGVFETHKDFLDDLNIARSVVVGRGGVWVLNPPYLLFYPDRNRDDIPDGDPEVHLAGFGLEDTHSGANSLMWGPDGWLYGAHGSTCTADIKGVKFLGQAIWRYHPGTGDFEVFAEGGGNTFSLDIDRKGRVFSGTNNGNTRGMHYPQGGAGKKNWGKHGPLMNPYSFGFYEHMAHTGYEPRFAQTLCIYEGGAIPQLEDHLIAPMSLMNRVMASRLSRDTSTYRTDDLDPLVLTDDRWFRPVDTKVGPDGAIYMADWYDSRLTHVDPRDTWDRDHGRIYRLKADGAGSAHKPFDLGALSNDELIKFLAHPNKWFSQTAIRIFHDRADRSLIPRFRKLVEDNTGQLALEAFWALNASGGFTDEVALRTLDHPDEFVRYWTIRLLGDRYPPARYSSSTRQPRPLPAALQQKLEAVAQREAEAQVRAQLASSAKRLPGANALPLARRLLDRSEDVDDKHIPLLIWWAIESKAVSDRDLLLGLLKETPLWHTPMFARHITARLGQRYTAERTEENLNTAARLLTLAPSPADVDELIRGMEAGLEGDRVTAVPAALQKEVAEAWQNWPRTPVLLSFALRLNHPPAADAAVAMLADPKTPAGDRKKLLDLLAERRVDAAVPVITAQLKREKADAARIDLLTALQRFNAPDIAQTILDVYPTATAKVRATALGILTSRADWARALLEQVDRDRIKKEHLTPANLMALQQLADPQTDKLLQKHWGNLRPSPEQIERRITEVRRVLSRGKGDPKAGRELFTVLCANCHKLNGEGAAVAPDLTGYERDNLDFMLPAIIDPSLGIREEYVAFNIATRDGQSFTGLIVEDTPQAVTLMDLTGNKLTLPREDIRTLQASHTSLMPEGLLDALDDQQVRDLFSYLTRRN